MTLSKFKTRRNQTTFLRVHIGGTTKIKAILSIEARNVI